jgi:methyl-accepting chemotaxis protein
LLGSLLIISVVAGFAVSRIIRVMDDTVADVLRIEQRITLATRWRGAAETAVTMVVGGAVTSDAVLAQQYDAQVKEITKRIGKFQDEIIKATSDPEEEAALEKISAEYKQILQATVKAWDLKGQGDIVEVQNFADDELTPLVKKYLESQDRFIQVLAGHSQKVRDQAQAQRSRLIGFIWVTAAIVLALVLWLARLLVASIAEPLQRAMAAMDAIAAGDLAQEIRVARQDEFGSMLQSLGRMAAHLRTVVGEVRQGVDMVTTAAHEIASGNNDLSMRTEQAAANLQETAASMEQLTATVTQASETALQANRLAGNAAQAAEKGGEVVGMVVASMRQITDSSRRINDIIGVIDGIAFQTNILALNAAVEAARAGEQGRGFAVVAAEVRSLAQRSAEAAKEIKGLIGTSVRNVDEGSAQVEQAGQSMHDIVASVRQVSGLIAEITASSAEQRDGIGQVNQAVSSLDQMTQQNAALVEQSSAAAVAMREQARRLAEVVAVFNVGGGGEAPSRHAADGRLPIRREPQARPAAQPAQIAASSSIQPSLGGD